MWYNIGIMHTYKTSVVFKSCVDCGSSFQRSGQNHKRCASCKDVVMKAAIKASNFKSGRLNGKGSGSNTGIGKENHMYRHGKLTFKRWAREKKQELGHCERCFKDLREATHYQWVGHHKDHNQMNNVPENLELLCRRCHQLEHDCVKAFEGVTTNRDKVTGRFKRTEAPATRHRDEMVCSA